MGLRATFLLPCLLLVSSPALHAGELRVVLVGTVSATLPTPLPAPFTSVAVGDAAEIVIELNAPTVVNAGQWIYPVDPISGGVTLGPVSLPYSTLVSSAVTVIDGGADTISGGVPLETSPITAMAFNLLDLTGGVLSAPDLSLLVGTTILPTLQTPIGAEVAGGGGNPRIAIEVSEMRFENGTCIAVGSNGCISNPNSTGFGASMAACGAPAVALNDLELIAYDLPTNAFGFFLTSQATGFTPNPGGSQGTLCLGGNIGRYVGPGQIQNSGTLGRIRLAVDLTQHPTPSGLVAVQPGETWYFSAWYRDAVAGTATSNFADSLQVDFL